MDFPKMNNRKGKRELAVANSFCLLSTINPEERVPFILTFRIIDPLA